MPIPLTDGMRTSDDSEKSARSLFIWWKEVRVRCLHGVIAKLGLSLVAMIILRSHLTVVVASTEPLTTKGYTLAGVLKEKALRFSPIRGYYYDAVANNFTLVSQGCRWWMKLGSQNPKVYDYQIVSSDGENTYLLLDYETRHSLEAEQGRAAKNVGDAAVISGNIPCFPLSEEAGAIWIAFASACYFESHAAEQLYEVPFSDYISSDTVLAGQRPIVERAKMLPFRSSPHLPRSLAYYTEKLAEQYSVTVPLGLARAFTNVVYEAIAYTNVDGFKFPTGAILSIFRPNPRQTGAIIPQLCLKFQMSITNVALGTSLESFRPQLPGNTVVNEQRFNKGTGASFEYFTSNRWPSTAELRASEAYRGAMAAAMANKTANMKPSKWVLRLIVFTTALLFPLALWLAFKFRRH